MPAAARAGDATNHPGKIAGPGSRNVLIEKKRAAVAGNLHTCALPPLAGPHNPSPLEGGSKSVFINGERAMRVFDKAGCGAVIVTGALTVTIGG